MISSGIPQKLSWHTYGVLALLCIAPIYQGGSPIPALTLLRIVTLILTASIVTQFFRVGSIEFPRSRAYLFVGLLVLFIIASVIISPYKNISVEWAMTLVLYILTFGLTLLLFQSKENLFVGVGVLVCLGALEAVLGIGQYSFMGDQRARGTFFNPDYYAGFLVPIITLCVSFVLAFRGIVWKEIAPSLNLRASFSTQSVVLFSFILMVSAVTLSGSRGAMLGLFVSTGIILLTRYGKRGALILLLLLVVFISVPNPVRDRFLPEKSGDIYSYSRLGIWENTGRMIIDYPTGIGLGMFQYYWPQYNFPVEETLARYGRWSITAHSEFLQVAAELGIAACLVFLIGLVVFSLETWRIYRGAASEGHRAMVLGLGCGMVGILVQSSVDSNFHEPAIALLFVFCGGLILCTRKLLVPEDRVLIALPTRDRNYCSFYRGSILIITILLGIVVLRPLVAYTCSELADRQVRKGNVDDAIGWYEKATWWNPGRTEYHSNLSAVLFMKYTGTGEVDWANEATFELNYARSLNPRNEAIPRRLGYVYSILAHNTRNPETQAYLYRVALGYYRSATSLNPYQPNNFQEMGKIYLKLGQIESAKLSMIHAVDLEPNFLPAHISLGRIYLSEGDEKKAVSEYRKVVATLDRYPNTDFLTFFEKQFLDVDGEAIRASLATLGNQNEPRRLPRE